jgi:two-component system response regulator
MITKRTILLVEDNADDAALTLRAFEKHDLADAVVHVDDGELALDYLFATGAYQGRQDLEQPTMMLLDLKLPKVTGIDVLERVRADARTRHLPVIVLTSSDEERDILACYERGANSFVRKPVDYARFMDAAKQLGLYWLVLNQQPA